MIKVKYVLLVICIVYSMLAISQDCAPSQAYEELDINNVRAGLKIGGDLWWESSEGNRFPRYAVPKRENQEDEVHSIFNGGLWLMSSDDSENIKGAVAHYPSDWQLDFWPGPINNSGSTTIESCSNWDRFFKVNKTEVLDHNQDFSDGIINIRREQIYGWPAKGNKYFEAYNGFELPSDIDLAPFYDENENGIYEPDLGEYPHILGDQSIWWVFNDIGNNHTETNFEKLNIEVQVMAFAHNSEITSINNSTFYQYKIINKGEDELPNFRLGLFVDPDLGCYLDDYIGFDTISQTAFAYNEDAVDGSVGNLCAGEANTFPEDIPMIGFFILESSFDYAKELCFVDRASIYSPSPPSIDPSLLPFHMYNNLMGILGSGTPMTFGGNGNNPGSIDTVKITYTGDPSDSLSWSMCNISSPVQDSRFVMSTGGITLQPGENATITYAVVTVLDVPHPCPSLEPLRDAVAEVKDGMILNSSDLNLTTETTFSTYPNPSSGEFSINFEESFSGHIQLLDIAGRVLFKQYIQDHNDVKINQNLATGLYIIRVTDDTGRSSSKKMVVSE